MPFEIRDINRDGDAEFENAVECPRCGCNSCEIIKYPTGKPGDWWNKSDGKARCDNCYLVFYIVEEQEEPEHW